MNDKFPEPRIEPDNSAFDDAKGAIIIDRVNYRKSSTLEFDNIQGTDLNIRPIAYTVFGAMVLFILFIAYLITYS